MTTASERKGRWMQTFTGRQYWVTDPRAEDVCIEDIAHHLSMLCRYTGATPRFYSVAEHSVLVSHLVPKDMALLGLMHDATEAYVGDVARPLKVALDNYHDIEEANWRVIAERFGLPVDLPPEVKDADNRILLAERRDLHMERRPLQWSVTGEPPHITVRGLMPWDAEQLFLGRFRELTE